MLFASSAAGRSRTPCRSAGLACALSAGPARSVLDLTVAEMRSFGRPAGQRSQRIVTGTGCEAIPFATTTRVLAPAGVAVGTVKSVDEATPGATDTELPLLVRA